MTTTGRFAAMLYSAALLSAAAAAPQAAATEFEITPDKADCMYKCGETAVFTIRAKTADGAAPQGEATVELDNFGAVKFATVKFDLSKSDTFKAAWTMIEPGFLHVSATGPDGGKPQTRSVAFEPEKIKKASPSPADFDEFWANAKKRLDETTPVDARLDPVEEKSTAKYGFYRISVASHGGRVWGWLSIPKDASPERKYPVRVEVPGAGRGRWAHDMLPDERAICLKMTAHPFPLAFDNKEFYAQYDRLEKELKEKYGVSNYAVAGLGKSREEFYYYRAFLGIDRAVNFVASLPCADRSSVTYSGASQGGGFGLAILALNRSITRGLLLVPALSDNMAPLVGRRSGCGPCHIYGQPEEDRLAAITNAPYFDGANFASRIRCPVRVLAGFRDEIVPPCAVYACYNEIGSADKAITHGTDMGHSCDGKYTRPLYAWLRSGERETGARDLVE